jgi:chromosome segregation ATPase
MAALQKEKESVELVKDFLERQLENLAVLDAARRDHLDETTSAAVQLSSIAADHQDSDIGAMRDTIHRLERELEEARAAADDASAGSQADLAAELEKTKTRLSKLAKEKAVIEEGMLQMMDAKERAEEQRAVIEERLADVEQQLARVTAQAVVQSQTASTNAVVAPDLVDAIVAAQREQLAQLTAEKERLASERDDLQRALDEHEARVTALTARAQQLEAQLETQTGEHAADVARMRVAADSALVAARRSHDEAVAQLRARLENEWRAREQELVQVREGSENDAAGRLLEAVSQRQAIEAQLIDLRERLEAVDAQLAKTTTAKSAAESELNAAQQVWVETQRQLERAVDDAVARLKTSDEARSKLEHEVDRLEDEKSVFEEGLMKMMEGRGADESARKRLERKLAEALERVQQLEEAVAANQLELDQLRQSDTLSHPPAEAHAAPSTPERGEDVEEDHRATAERNTWREERAGLETQLERARQREIDATRERDELAKEAQRMIDDRVAEIEALRRQLEELSQHHAADSGDVAPGTDQEDDATKLRAITDSLEGVERAMIEDARQQKELEAELEAARQELREEKRLTRELKEALEHDRSTADQAHDDAEERSAKDARVTALVRECEELRRDNDDLRKELDEVKREGEVELRRALADMRREKEELQREIVNAMVRLEELDKEHKHALKSNDDAEQSVGSQGEAEEDKEAQTRIELERDHEREIRVALQDQLRDAATLRARDVLALEQIKCENDNLMDMLEATIVQRENLKTIVRELQLQSPSTIVRRLSQTDASDAAAATAGQERANDAAEVVQLRGEVERLQSEKMALEVAIVQARMNETERESQRRQDEAADAEEFEQLKRQVGELQADKQRLADRLAAALHQSRATGDDEVESTEQATTVAALRQQLAEQDQELQDLRQTLAQRSAEGEKDEDDDVPFELLVEEWERQETERELAERQRVEEQLEQLRRLLAAHEPAVEDLETRFTSAVSDVRTRLAQKQEELDELADVRQDEDADADTAPAAEGCDNEHAREADVRDVSDAERSEWLEEKRALLDQIDQLRTEVLQLQARVERAAQQDDERLQETLTLRDEIARSNTIVDELTKELEASRRRTSSPSRPPAASSRPKPTTPSPDPTLRRALVAREAQVIETVERRLASLSAKSTVSRGKLEMLRSDVAEARKALDRRVAATAGGRPQAGGGDEQLQFIESLEGIIGSLCDIVAAESGVPRAPSAADYQRDHDLDLAADDDFDFGDEAEAESREDRGGEDRRAALFLMRSKVEEMIQRMATAHLEGGVRSSSSSPMAASRHH